ncbi:hypothetical protein VTI28DRAFT_522 [Corynascus sepedonium]
MAALVPRGYRSATEYRFRQDQTDAIVRATAYHRKDFCHSVIWFSPREHVGIRPSIATPFPRTPDTGLGTLGLLPLELLHDVLLRLDIRSLFNFRQANLSSRRIVDSLHQYQIMVSHGLNLLCALLRTRLANGNSLLDFYHVLCTKACTLCGEFGGFVSLLTWKRCCFACLQGALETQVQTLAGIRKQFHLTKTELGQLKSFRTLPGIYSMEKSVHKSRIAVVSVHLAKLVSGQQPHAAAAQAQPASSGRNRKFNFMIDEPAESSTECRVLGVNSLSKKTSSALGGRNGHSTLATRYMRKISFWTISDGVNRLSFCGNRVVKARGSQPSYRRLLGEEGFSAIEND